MALTKFEKQEKQIGKKLYDYQHGAIDKIFEKISDHPDNYNLLYQLPTGGGKTVIFSEIARRYIETTGKKVLILTHRIVLSKQTSHMLFEFGVENKIIDSNVKEVSDDDNLPCYVAMVETLNNRIKDEKVDIHDIGLVIVDEAHYNSFRKLFKYFEALASATAPSPTALDTCKTPPAISPQANMPSIFVLHDLSTTTNPLLFNSIPLPSKNSEFGI